MPMATFAADLVEKKLSRAPIGRSIRTEETLEREFVIPIASRIASRGPDVLLFTHPFRSIDIHTHLVPDCLWRTAATGEDWSGTRFERPPITAESTRSVSHFEGARSMPSALSNRLSITEPASR